MTQEQPMDTVVFRLFITLKLLNIAIRSNSPCLGPFINDVMQKRQFLTPPSPLSHTYAIGLMPCCQQMSYPLLAWRHL